MLLRIRHVQPFSGEEEELDHLDVRRQLARMQRTGIGQIGIAAEQPVDHRTDKAPFKQAPGLGFSSVSAEKKVRLDRAVGGGARIQRIDDVVGLAEPERQADHEVVPTSRMISSAIASGSENCFGILMRTRARLDSQPPRIGRQPAKL